MSDEAKKSPDEIPTFRITEKRVDDSWKEEARREKEAAAKARAAQAAPAEAPTKGEAAAPQPPEAAEKKPTGTPAEQQQTKIFMTFLAGLAQQALMQLGELENPYTGGQDMDLKGARYTIELLAVIQGKTKGNLTPDEDQSLSETIHDLKMRYVEIANEVQRQMAAQMQQGGPGGPGGPMRPGPGGTIPRH
jgi:hypothetical protein